MNVAGQGAMEPGGVHWRSQDASGVAGRGDPGVRTPPPELPSGVHAKRKKSGENFLCKGGGAGS